MTGVQTCALPIYPSVVVDRDTEQIGIRLRYKANPSNLPWLDLDATAYYNDFELTEDRFSDDRLDVTQNKTYGIDLSNAAELFSNETISVSLVAGAEAFTVEQSGTRNGQARPQFPDSEVTFVAGFGQLELRLFDRLSIIPALRYDRFELNADGGFAERSEDEVTPRVALGFDLTEDLYAWGSYSQAFRAPALNELFVDGVHFTVQGGPPDFPPGTLIVNEFVPTPDLDSEMSESFEGGLRYRHRGLVSEQDSLGFSITYFNADVDNFIDQVVTFIAGPPSFTPPRGPLVFPGATENINVDASIEGVEGSVEYENRFLRASVAGSLTDATNDVTGEGLASITQDNVTFTLIGKFLADTLRAGGRVTVAGDRNDVPDGSPTTEGYTVADLFATWRPANPVFNDRMVVRFNVENANDADFNIHPNELPQPGRSFRIGLGYSF